MSFKLLLPICSTSEVAGMSLLDDSASVLSSALNKDNDLAKKIWTETQWSNLSIQAKNLGLPKLPYFDPQTMLLSKEVNARLWRQLLRLYNTLGAENAVLATPVMVEGGEVKWHSYVGDSKGQEADVFDYHKQK